LLSPQDWQQPQFFSNYTAPSRGFFFKQMNNDFKRIQLDALVKKAVCDEQRKKWKETPDEDPIEKELALSRYVESKMQYYDLIEQIKNYD